MTSQDASGASTAYEIINRFVKGPTAAKIRYALIEAGVLLPEPGETALFGLAIGMHGTVASRTELHPNSGVWITRNGVGTPMIVEFAPGSIESTEIY